jgi:hypothetical protein
VSYTPPDPENRVHIGEEQARGARRVGLVWMLVASLAAGVIALAITLAYFAGALHEANNHGGPGAIPKNAAAQFHAPATSLRAF